MLSQANMRTVKTHSQRKPQSNTNFIKNCLFIHTLPSMCRFLYKLPLKQQSTQKLTFSGGIYDSSPQNEPS